MAQQVIYGERRDTGTKGQLNEMRRNQYVPGVVYGMGNIISVKLGTRQLVKVFNLHGTRGIFSLQIEGEAKPYSVIIREIQRNPVNGQMIHLDFLTIDMTEKLHSNIPIYIHGDEIVNKKGNVTQLGAKEIEVECMPKDLPESISCDVSELEAGDRIIAGDLVLPPGVEMISDPETVIATVLAPRIMDDEDIEASEEENEQEGPAEETE